MTPGGRVIPAKAGTYRAHEVMQIGHPLMDRRARSGVRSRLREEGQARRFPAFRPSRRNERKRRMAEFRVMGRAALAEPRPAYKPLRGQAALDGRGTRDAFLASLRSAGRYKYGRYNGLPLRYAGGKSLAVGHVVENLPSRLSRVVSPFIGGGSVEIACARELGVPVQGYDVFDVLTNYWEVQLSAPKALADRLMQWEPTQQRYRQVKQRLKEHWIGTRPIHDALELAAHYWFNHNLAYGPGFLGWMSKIYEDEVRYERLVAKVERFSCPTLSVRQGGFEETVPAHSGDFLYCDPPYYLDGDSKCSAASTRSATSPFTTRTSATTSCATSSAATRGDSSSPTTTAKRSASGTPTARSSRSNGSTRLGKARHASARTASRTEPTTTSKPPTNSSSSKRRAMATAHAALPA